MFNISFLLTLPSLFFFFNDTATTEIYTLSLHDALPIYVLRGGEVREKRVALEHDAQAALVGLHREEVARSEEHTSELQSRRDLVCRLLLEKKKKNTTSLSASLFFNAI